MNLRLKRVGWWVSSAAVVMLSPGSGWAQAPQSGAAMHAEGPSAGGPEFDVVSIKLNKSGSGHAHLHTSSENADLSAENVPLKELLAFAYDVSESRIVGLSGAVSSARFDVVAKAAGAVNDTAKGMDSRALDKLTQEMMRAMLAERFKLVAHREKKELPVYALELAKGGLKATASTVEGTHVEGRRGSLVAKGIGMAELADELSRDVGRIVIDKTAVAGRFDLTLRWTPDDGPSGEADGSAPSIFTAVGEQLGLKLEAEKAPVDVLVVDRVAMAAEN